MKVSNYEGSYNAVISALTGMRNVGCILRAVNERIFTDMPLEYSTSNALMHAAYACGDIGAVLLNMSLKGMGEIDRFSYPHCTTHCCSECNIQLSRRHNYFAYIISVPSCVKVCKRYAPGNDAVLHFMICASAAAPTA